MEKRSNGRSTRINTACRRSSKRPLDYCPAVTIRRHFRVARILIAIVVCVFASNSRANTCVSGLESDHVFVRMTERLSQAPTPIELNQLNVVWASVNVEGTGVLLVLRIGESPIGYFGLRPGGSTQYVYVEKDYRRVRLGELLYTAAGYFLFRSGIANLTSDMLDPSSRAVWESFEKQGIASKNGQRFALVKDAYATGEVLFNVGEFWASRFKKIENWKETEFKKYFSNYDIHLEMHFDADY